MPEHEAKQDAYCSESDRTHEYGPQCASSFSFTTVEAIIMHMLLVANAAAATSFVQSYPQ